MNAKTPALSPQDMATLSDLAFQLAHSEKPGVREHFAMLVNTVNPQIAKGAFSDVILQRQLAAFKKTIDDERQQEKMGRVLEAQEAQKAATVKKYGYNDDQVKKLDEIRSQYGVSDWDAAARIYSTFNPPENPALKPPPEMMDGATWEFPTVPGPDGKMLEFKDFVKNPRKYANQTAYNMITEFKRGRLSPAFQGT